MSSKNKTTATTDEAKRELVPKLRFPEFRGTDWIQKKLEDVAPLQRGFDLPSDLIQPGDIPIVYSNGIQKYHEVGIVTAPGLVTGRSGTIGKLHFIEHGEYWPHNTSLWVTDFKGNNPRFVYYLYDSIGMGRFSSGSGVPTLNRNDVHAFSAQIPKSTIEQQKIAECLSSVDKLIAAQARKVDAIKTHKKGLMQQLFPREGETQPRLRFPEFRNTGEWQERKLSSICDIQRGKFSHRPRNDPRFFGGKYPFIQTGDVVKSEGGAVIASQSLNEQGLAVSKLFKPTIVLITIAANIGDTGLLQTEGCFTDSVVGLVPGKDVIPVFLELIMRGQKEYLNKVATTGAQKNINNEILREVVLLLPSVAEQQRIASCLSSLGTLITTEDQKLEALKTHKKGLMQQLFPSPEEVEA